MNRDFLTHHPRFDVFERFGQVNAPVFEKAPESDLRQSSPRAFEGSLIAALVIVVALLRFLPIFEHHSPIRLQTQEIVEVEDIEQTRQENRPPPPPRPSIPIEMPSDEALEDVTIASTELDLTRDVPPPQPRSDEERFFMVVEEMPEIIGGMEALLSKLVYPDIARRAGIEGRVIVVAYVDETGRVVKTEVLKGVSAGGLNEAAQRAVEQMRFIPGRQRGKPVPVRIALPVNFTLKTAER